MGDTNRPDIWQEIVQGLGKGLMWLMYILIGVAAKLAFDSRSNQLSKKEIVIKSVLSIFCGYIAAVICEVYHYNNLAKLVVPVATLLGEGLIAYFMTNWKRIFRKWMPGSIGDEIEKK